MGDLHEPVSITVEAWNKATEILALLDDLRGEAKLYADLTNRRGAFDMNSWGHPKGKTSKERSESAERLNDKHMRLWHALKESGMDATVAGQICRATVDQIMREN